MLELDSLVVAQIVNDAQMISLMGITVDDDRVYAWYPTSDIVYTINQAEVAIIYRNSFGSRPASWSYPTQFPNLQYFFRVLSISQLKLRQTTERLIELFDKTAMQSTNWAVKWIEVIGAADGMYEGSPTQPILSKNVTFAFNVVVKRGVVTG
jgi:hypothetical protein